MEGGANQPGVIAEQRRPQLRHRQDPQEFAQMGRDRPKEGLAGARDAAAEDDRVGRQQGATPSERDRERSHGDVPDGMRVAVAVAQPVEEFAGAR